MCHLFEKGTIRPAPSPSLRLRFIKEIRIFRYLRNNQATTTHSTLKYTYHPTHSTLLTNSQTQSKCLHTRSPSHTHKWAPTCTLAEEEQATHSRHQRSLTDHLLSDQPHSSDPSSHRPAPNTLLVVVVPATSTVPLTEQPSPLTRNSNVKSLVRTKPRTVLPTTSDEEVQETGTLLALHLPAAARTLPHLAVALAAASWAVFHTPSTATKNLSHLSQAFSELTFRGH